MHLHIYDKNSHYSLLLYLLVIVSRIIYCSRILLKYRYIYAFAKVTIQKRNNCLQNCKYLFSNMVSELKLMCVCVQILCHLEFVNCLHMLTIFSRNLHFLLLLYFIVIKKTLSHCNFIFCSLILHIQRKEHICI